MKLHGFAHHVGYFVVASVVHALHGVQNAPLNRLQSVLDMGHGAFQNHVRGVIKKPVFVHPRKVMYGRCVKAVGRSIVGMFVHGEVLVLLLQFVVVANILVVVVVNVV